MPRFAANLSLLYTELPFLERFGAAAADGFAGVEYLFPYEFAVADIAGQLKTHGLQQVLFNAPPGDWAAGERGLACIPGREAEFAAGMEQALAYAAALQCPHIHAMAGIVPAGEMPQTVRATYVANLRQAARRAAASGVTLMIEPINTRDMPGYFLNLQADAHALLDEIGSPAVQVQMDLYHCQIMEGDLARKLRQYLPTGRVGHIQIAGVPERFEPDVGEVHYPYLFDLIDQGGFNGWVGCEYRPARGGVLGGTSLGLGWRPAPRG
jgi:hydroxypyruvate isomerase